MHYTVIYQQSKSGLSLCMSIIYWDFSWLVSLICNITNNSEKWPLKVSKAQVDVIKCSSVQPAVQNQVTLLKPGRVQQSQKWSDLEELTENVKTSCSSLWSITRSRALKDSLLYRLFDSNYDQILQKDHHPVLKNSSENRLKPWTHVETDYWGNKSGEKTDHFLISFHTTGLLVETSGDAPCWAFEGISFTSRPDELIFSTDNREQKSSHLWSRNEHTWL